MTISKKIVDEIMNLDEKNDFKKLLIDLLELEDRGSHKINQLFEKEIKDYLLMQGDDNDGSHN